MYNLTVSLISKSTLRYVTMGGMASQITSLTIVSSTVYSGANQRAHQSPASLAFVRGIHRGPVNSPHKWPVTRKLFPFDDVIMKTLHLYPNYKCLVTTQSNICSVNIVTCHPPHYILRWGLETLGNWVIIISGEGFFLLGVKLLPEPVEIKSWIRQNKFR